jgi:transcription elongation GreA/GreB family factor
MSAAIQLVTQPIVDAEVYDHRLDKPFNNVSIFELAPEQRLRRSLSQIAELQSEVRALREELARSERTISHQEQLLRNAMVREQELRAQLGKEIC